MIIGPQTNVQDRAVISTITREFLPSGLSAETVIGVGVTIGHGAMLTSCTIGGNTLIGQGSVVQEGCVSLYMMRNLSERGRHVIRCHIGNDCIIAAGAVVLPDTIVPDGQLWAGNPAVYIRDVTDEEKEAIKTVRACVLFACLAMHF